MTQLFDIDIVRQQQRSRPSRQKIGAWFALLGLTLLPWVAKADLPLAVRINAAHGPQALRLTAVAQPNLNCSLVLPSNPLSAEGLATPYRLKASNPADGPCDESNRLQSAFVQAAVLDPATGKVWIYNPLVITEGTEPKIKPVLPTLPPNAVVALWFGYNGETLSLDGDGLNVGNCVNGKPGVSGDNFGQFAHCNAPAFFRAAHRAIRAGKLKVPPLGTGKDGRICPSVRDFSVVDQDQSDNLPSTYLVTSEGKLAQNIGANRAALPDAETLNNPSDNRLVTEALDKALGCTPWTAPDLADLDQRIPALPLNELQARAYQRRPVALVPANDPMVLSNETPDLAKLNAYRRGVDQPVVDSLDKADTTRYCRNLYRVAARRFQRDQSLFESAPSPLLDIANSLFTFLAQRFVVTDGILSCSSRLGLPNPVTVEYDDGGRAIGATINQLICDRNKAKLDATAVIDDQKAATEAAAAVNTP